jgi:carboxypeptidase Q
MMRLPVFRCTPLQAKTMMLLLLGSIVVFTPVRASSPAEEDPLQHPIAEHMEVVEAIFSNALTSHVAYENLRILCATTEGRIAGSPAAAAAVEFTRQIMDNMGLDSVYLQELTVPNWKRGEPEVGRIISPLMGQTAITVTALGLSVGTGPEGILAGIVEVSSMEELEALGREHVEGKIVFFNQPFDQTHYNTFRGYSGAVWQRFSGPARAADLGAAAALIRSVTSAHHDHAHTGVTRYREDNRNIPSLAVSPVGANILTAWLENDPDLQLYLRNTSYRLPDAISYNVVGEIRGSVYPNEVITVGGHLDAWDNSQGAHDDGGGCMQSIDVLRLYQELGLRPKRTLRAVMFMDEEISQSGGRKYAELAHQRGEQHYFAIESDRGVFTPRGFSIDASDERVAAVQQLQPYFTPYGMHEIFKGGSGVDIGPLKNHFDMTLSGLIVDSQRYFDMHHAASDTFDQVNQREMQLGSAAMAAIIYLLDTMDVVR